jgi:ankyrin repeat protein
LEDVRALLQDQLLQKNAAGLSAFHVCAERNNHEMLKVLLEYMIENSSDDKEALEKVISIKDKNDANVLHVAAFCGNLETVTVLMEVIQKAFGDQAVEILDKMDGQARTAYWLAMVQGKEAVGKLLADAGVDTKHPNMVKEIEEAQKKREERAASRLRTVDGAALLGR